MLGLFWLRADCLNCLCRFVLDSNKRIFRSCESNSPDVVGWIRRDMAAVLCDFLYHVLLYYMSLYIKNRMLSNYTSQVVSNFNYFWFNQVMWPLIDFLYLLQHSFSLEFYLNLEDKYLTKEVPGLILYKLRVSDTLFSS